jgi:sugar phosphate isomerase/epimerase
MNLSRRDFAKYALGAATAATALAKPNSVVNGVILGTSTYSYRDLDLDGTLRAMTDVGFSVCEFYENHAWPARPVAEGWPEYNTRMRKWVADVPLDHFRRIGNRFEIIGIEIHAFTHAFSEKDTDEEIEKGFQMARAIGAEYIFSSTQLSLASRLNRFAAKYKIPVALHNHSRAPELATPKDFEQAMRGNSHIGVNLDIGHFVAAGFDPVTFTEKHHDRIWGFHMKDRKANQGPNTPFGQGDTPIKEILQLCKRRKFKIPALIEYEYKGADTLTEVRKCFEYMKAALA